MTETSIWLSSNVLGLLIVIGLIILAVLRRGRLGRLRVSSTVKWVNSERIIVNLVRAFYFGIAILAVYFAIERVATNWIVWLLVAGNILITMNALIEGLSDWLLLHGGWTLPKTRGDVRQFAVALAIALGSAILWELKGILDTGTIWEIDWRLFSYQMADNIVQGIVTYTLAWWGLTKSGFVRRQEVIPASQVVPRKEEVVAPTKEGGPV